MTIAETALANSISYLVDGKMINSLNLANYYTSEHWTQTAYLESMDSIRKIDIRVSK